MTTNPNPQHRHSIRLLNYDYSRAGAYFITLCTWQHQCLFGEIADGVMTLHDIGRIVATEWEKTPHLRKYVVLDEFVIMPNHLHAIFFLVEDAVGEMQGDRATQRVAPTETVPKLFGNNGSNPARPRRGDPLGRPFKAPTGPQPGSVGAIMGQFKAVVTKRSKPLGLHAGKPLWQRNYYERVIRDDDELSQARTYIVNNPQQWELDKENQVNCRENGK